MIQIAIKPISSKIPIFFSCFDVESFVIDLRGNTEKVSNAKPQILETLPYMMNRTTIPRNIIINPPVIKFKNFSSILLKNCRELYRNRV